MGFILAKPASETHVPLYGLLLAPYGLEQCMGLIRAQFTLRNFMQMHATY